MVLQDTSIMTRGLMGNIVFPDESYRIMNACFSVYNFMGCGFLESVYQECLEIELNRTFRIYFK